jgi:O-antigen/teichoic acid export membrane protein
VRGDSKVPTRQDEGQAPADRQGLAGVSARLGTANLLVAATTFIAGPIVARTLGPTGRGFLAAVLVPPGLAVFVLQIGLGYYAARAAAQGERPGALTASLGTATFAVGLLGAAALIPAAAGFSQGNDTVHTYLLVGFALIPLQLLTLLAQDVLWGLERWRPLLISRVMPPCVVLGCTIFLAATGTLTVATAALVNLVPTASIGVVLIASRRDLRPSGFRPAIVRRAFAFGVRGWPGTLANVANIRLDQLVMIPLVNARQLGLYAVATTIATLVTYVVGPLGGAMYPRVAAGDTQLVARTARATVAGVIVIELAIAAVAPIAIPLVFGHAFSSAVLLVWLLGVAALPQATANLLAGALLAAGRPLPASYSEFAAVAVTVPGLLILLPPLGAVGAALVSIAAYSMNCAVLLHFGRREFGGGIRDFVLVRRGDLRGFVQIVTASPFFPSRLRRSSL